MAYKGRFEGWRGIQVRIPPALHKEILRQAVEDEVTLADILAAGLFAYLTEDGVTVDTQEVQALLDEWAAVPT